MEWGQILALVAAALAVILPGMGSSKGVGLSGETASGVSTEIPKSPPSCWFCSCCPLLRVFTAS